MGLGVVNQRLLVYGYEEVRAHLSLMIGHHVDYFDTEITRQRSFTSICSLSKYFDADIQVNVNGGGLSAQADAIKLGIARALSRS